MIKVLQKAGGDAFVEDKYGHTPFYYRTHGKRLNIRTLKDNAVSQGNCPKLAKSMANPLLLFVR
jgi:hypothetical protein